MIERREPPHTEDERVLLDEWLDYYRATLLHKCAGLTPEQLAQRSCEPSDMTLIGLVRHLTEMERAYAHRLAQPALPLYYVAADRPEADFEDVSPDTTSTDLTTFAEHCARSRDVMAERPLDGTLRWHYLYLIKEYARHLGHADLIRERVDGTTGE